MFQALPDQVSVYEVSPRDGLQNEAAPIPLEAKKRLVEALLASGIRRLELTSFVSPRWVPQLADADELTRDVKAGPGVTLSALCPNAKGFERARAVGLPEIAVFMSASETHNKKNTNKSVEASLDTFSEVMPPALEARMRVERTSRPCSAARTKATWPSRSRWASRAGCSTSAAIRCR
ncbi:MAG: hypothetical protein U0263_12750 [Polyangiaceae bacterium]